MSNRKVTKPRKDAAPRWQTHVYLSEADYLELKTIAERESRSVTGQIEHFIRNGIREASSIPRPHLSTPEK